MKNSRNKLLLALLLISMLTFSIATAFGGELVIDDFKDPTYLSKLMARFWFADGSAGLDDNDVIAKSIEEMAAEGFGGVEVQYLADNGDYTNEQAGIYGWGTESWVLLLKKIFTAANNVEGGFRVDITVTSHWPPNVNLIDPNDDQAATEISYALTKVTASDVASGSIELNLPETKYLDNRDGYFVFADTLIAVNVAQVVSIEGETIYLDLDTMSDMLDTAAVTYDDVSALAEGDYYEADGVYYKGSAAGVPSEEFCEEMGWDYAEIIELYGEEPAEDADLSVSYNGKMDADFLRARMADWQYVYSADLSGLSLEGLNDSEDIQVGDWVAVATYYRGTGQVMSGGTTVTTYNRSYVPTYYDEGGVDAVSYYWWNYIIDDELEALLNENGGSIFEDSLELSSAATNWSWDLLVELPTILGEDYAYTEAIPAIIGTSASTDTYAYAFVSEDDELISRIESDYDYLLNELYLEEHVQAYNDFAATFGYTYRAQSNGFASRFVVDVVETDAAGQAAVTGALMQGTNGLLSKESMAGFSAFSYSLEDSLIEFGSNFSWGYNRVITHGFGYTKMLNGGNEYAGDWPGYPPFGTSFGESYGYHMPYWDSYDIITEFVARAQAVLQKGQNKLDIGIMGSIDAADDLEDYGYTFSIVGSSGSTRYATEAMLFTENCYVTNNVLYEDGPAYKAIVIGGIETFSVLGTEKLIELAEAGLPIILQSCDFNDVYGTYTDDENPEALAAAFEELCALDNVIVLSDTATVADIVAALASLNVDPYASYDVENLENKLYVDEVDGSSYYYFYNNTTENSMMPSSTIGNYKTTDIEDVWVNLEGTGTPYFLNPYNGEITQAEQYVINSDGTISVHIDKLAAGQGMFIAITEDTENFPTAASFATAVSQSSSDSDGGGMDMMMMMGGSSDDSSDEGSVYFMDRDEDGALVLKAYESGDYTVTLDDGSTFSASVAEMIETVVFDSFELVIGSWGPVYEDAADMLDPDTQIQTVDPGESVFTDVDFGTQGLVMWQTIEATDEQLETMGVTAMSEVSGRGYYTTTFEWDADTYGAILTYSWVEGQITGLTVNGTVIDTVDNVDDQMDIGDYLVTGTNTLTIEYTSSINNRAAVESRALSALTAVDYGLTSATLVPYAYIPVQ